MDAFATTKMSSKGQVVIPEQVRSRLGLREGDQFVVLGQGDVVILKAISPPSMADFDDLIATARRQARRAKLRKRDVSKAVAEARSRK